MISSVDTGRLGEYLAAYELERAGFNCALVDRRGADIWCRDPDGMFFRVEVKSASAVSHEGRNAHSYSFQVTNREADWYAFVALDKELMFFQPRDALKPYVTHRFRPEMFTEDHMNRTMGDMMLDERVLDNFRLAA